MLLDAAVADPFLYTLLATGLRITEACRLVPADIDGRAGLIHVRSGKGDKARSVKLGEKHLRLLRRYWVVEHPARPWLFPAQRLVAPGRVDPAHRWAERPVSLKTVHDRSPGSLVGSACGGASRRTTCTAPAPPGCWTPASTSHGPGAARSRQPGDDGPLHRRAS